MPPKRANPSGSASERPAKKAATGGSKASTPRLKKSTSPKWDEVESYSNDQPTGEWGKKCVERWCLLAPYDTSISEDRWKAYYQERSALDLINSTNSDENKAIVSEELGQNTWTILRRASGNVAAAIFGSALDDEHKNQIGRTLLGSLYFTELWGNDEGDGSPRSVRAMSRLYSPFGLGTSVDLFYNYHLRQRMFGKGERFASLYVNARTIDDCDAKDPAKSSAIRKNANGVEKAASEAITVFDRNGSKTKGTTAANIKTFEEPLFGCEGWLSPLKLANILLAAAGVMHYKEDDTETPRNTLSKFQLFQGESDGKAVLKQEFTTLAQLEKEAGEGEECVPQRLLLLARQEARADAEQGGEDSKE